jgi:uncharacterized protein
MESAVVVATALGLAAAGVAALRFNFGGVGASEGAYGHGHDEACDVGAAVTAVASRLPARTPLAIVGYSFGAWVGARAASGLPEVASVVAIAPPLSFFDWGFLRTLDRAFAVVVGDRDQYCPLADLERLLASVDAAPPTVLRGADHFFAGREREVAAAVVAAVDV